MNSIIELKEKSPMLRLASQVTRDLQDKKSRNEIIRKVNGDVELFKWYLYSCTATSGSQETIK